ncbi:MAG: hypothetical protein WCJ36_01030 [Candidatus Saccharibacteria bacterium]
MEKLDSTKNPEILPNEARIHKSAELLRNPFERESPYDDRIFITANVTNPSPNMWEINVDSSYPTVVMNDKSRQEFGLYDIPTVPEVRAGDSEISLVSGGSWIWIEDNKGNEFLPLLRRDSEASVDSNCLTGAAGRCGEVLSKTSINETNQEFIFLQTESDSTRLLAFYKDDDEKEETARQKIEQVRDNIEALKSKYETTGEEKYKERIEALTKFNGIEDLELIKISDAEVKGQELDTIYTKIDGEVVDIARGISYMDKKNNTLEVRVVLRVVLPEGVKVSAVMDGESFLRDTLTVRKEDLSKLEGDNLVPALQNYIRRVNMGTYLTKSLLDKQI